MKKVNKALAEKGLELIRYDGYFTFDVINVDLLPMSDFVKKAERLKNGDPLGEMICVYNLNHLSMNGWMREVRSKISEVESMYDHISDDERKDGMEKVSSMEFRVSIY